MRIPNSISLGKHNIKIHKVKPIAESYIGRLNTRSLDMYINQNYCPSLQEEAFFHETVHAISLVYGLNLSEHQVGILGEQIYSSITPMLEAKNVRKSTKK